MKEVTKINYAHKEAREIMKFINKGISSADVVHHKDGNPFNNDPDIFKTSTFLSKM